MKKYLKIIFILTLPFILLATYTLAYNDKAEIISVKGDVKILARGKAEWIKAEISMILREGDRLKTGRDSSCDLAFDRKGKNSVGILENSDVIILLRKNEKIEIVDAIIYATLSNIPKGSSFEFKTPTAVCGARGTGLGIKSNKDNTEASAYKNDIFVKNSAGAEKNIKQGFKRNIDKSGKISEELLAKLEEMEKFNSWMGNLDKILKSESRSESARRENVTGNIVKGIEKTEEMSEKSDEKAIGARDVTNVETRKNGGGTGY